MSAFVLRDVSVELPFILMHPKPVEPPVSRPQSGDLALPQPIGRAQPHWHTSARLSAVSVSIYVFTLHISMDTRQFPWQRRGDILMRVCFVHFAVPAVPEMDPPIDTNLIEFDTK